MPPRPSASEAVMIGVLAVPTGFCSNLSISGSAAHAGPPRRATCQALPIRQYAVRTAWFPPLLMVRCRSARLT